MNEATAFAPQTDPSEFVRLWADSFSQVMSQVSGSSLACSLTLASPADWPTPAENDLWVVVALSGARRGEMTMRLPPTLALQIAQTFMSEPRSSEVQLTDEHREAVMEFMRQVAGIVATGAKARWGEIQTRLERAPGPPSWAASGSFWLQSTDSSSPQTWLEISLSVALAAELRAEPVETAQTASTTGASEPAVPPPAPAVDGKLGLLMDVHLAMMLRFGGRRLLLREVLELGPGAVVELDRKVDEPVDLLLDGKLVARGEVVVMDGSYGLRVIEVTSAATR